MAPARTFRNTLQMQPANVIVGISLRPLYLCFSPPPPFEAQCIRFQRGGLEAAITSSHIWDVWAKPLYHQLYLFHFCLNYFWVFFFTFPFFKKMCMQIWGVEPPQQSLAATVPDECTCMCGVCLRSNFQKYTNKQDEDHCSWVVKWTIG